MFAIQHSTGSYTSMVSSRAFGVSLLRHTQAEVAALFATKGPEKTGKTTFEQGKALHVPLIPGALAHVECLTNQIFISGDHAIVVGLVEEARTFDGEPLLYFAQRYGTFRPLGAEA
jgi:flavin reductase ActVB